MRRAVISGTGMYVPEKVVHNLDLEKLMDTSDEWIRQRTGIEERRYIEGDVGSSDLAERASRSAMEMAGLAPGDIDMIVFATLSPDHFFPGNAVILQNLLGMNGKPALDVRNQCSGFIYGLSIADAYIRAGVYRHILLVGAEVHSTGLDFSDHGRDVAVIFGDGAGAVVVSASDDRERGILATFLHADGAYARELWVEAPSSRTAPMIGHDDIEERRQFPRMNGKEVFKHAVTCMPAVVHEALAAAGLGPADIDMLIPHQANLRISQMVQRRLDLPDEKVCNNIQKYGNTTAASIPIALDECVRSGRIGAGDLVCMCSFGAGFTWGSALVRW